MEEDIISEGKKSKNNKTKTKNRLKRSLFVLAISLFISFLVIIPFFRDNYLSWRLWSTYLILITVIQYSIWRRLAQWIRCNRKKIPLKTFEYLFFIFIFITSYLLCLLLDDSFPFGFISVIFIFSAMSSAYCGELFFLEGISDFRNEDEAKKTYDVGKIRHYDERIFILAFYVVFIPVTYYLLHTGFNSEFLIHFLIPILVFMGVYMIIFALTEGKYYENPTDYIKIKSCIYIFIIFFGIYAGDFIAKIFMGDNIDIQIINFIDTFW